jgi:hypothetical protein
VKVLKDQEDEKPESEPSERDNLIAEKQRLAEEIGIWETFNPVPNYQDTEQHKRIEVIDKRLAEIG